MLKPQRFQIKIGERYIDTLGTEFIGPVQKGQWGTKNSMVNKILVQKPLT